jgi:hypothetical protein
LFTFSDPFDGEFDCGTIVATFSGHDDVRVTTWFNASGDPIKQIGQIKAIETDVNPITQKSIEVTTNLMVHVDFVAGTTTITDIRNLSTSTTTSAPHSRRRSAFEVSIPDRLQ